MHLARHAISAYTPVGSSLGLQYQLFSSGRQRETKNTASMREAIQGANTDVSVQRGLFSIWSVAKSTATVVYSTAVHSTVVASSCCGVFNERALLIISKPDQGPSGVASDVKGPC